MTFLCVALAVICGVEAIADLVSVLSNVKGYVSDHGIVKANGKKHMLGAAVRRCPFCNSRLNIRIIGDVGFVVLLKGRSVKVHPNFFYAFPIIRYDVSDG